MSESGVIHAFFRPSTGRLFTPDAASPANLSIITTHHPGSFLKTLEDDSHMKYLVIRRPVKGGRGGYILEEVHMRRNVLELVEGVTGIPYTQTEYDFYSGIYWPKDLREVRTLWQTELTFTFLNLRLLDVGIRDAVIWLTLIIDSIPASTVLRRVIVRNCHDWNMQLLIGWAYEDDEPFIAVFRQRLPTLQNAGKIAVLYCAGPRSVFSSTALSSSDMSSSDEEKAGEMSREASWIYDGVKDPFGCM
ncbi:hypothetical protein BYT27DRAFT_7210899 [Phlegmacium glaucopus]|nr:hypothetical protein BYT27DRAFT_7210899 [Phlegmacium glaucopus]